MILTLPLPADQPEPAALCQQLCGVQDECDYWHYDGAVFSCRYYLTIVILLCYVIYINMWEPGSPHFRGSP